MPAETTPGQVWCESRGEAPERMAAGAQIAPGPRAVEAALLGELQEACARGERDPALLARPLRVVVPSHALREHLNQALVAGAGRARLGVRIQTLEALALEVLERSGLCAAPSRLYAVAVREHARREAPLASALDALEDGYAAVVASVDDLLDAGFTSGHLQALGERLAEAASGPLRARTSALLRVAAAVSLELEVATLGHRSADLARAAECLHVNPTDALPTRALWIHGFADATGVQLDLLEKLARCFDARVWIDRPPGVRDSGFGARLRERLAAAGGDFSVAAPTETEIESSRHADPEAEARAAAVWAREALEAGAQPEQVAIVARDLSRYRLGLRRHLRRLGVPFSGAGERGAAGPATRRIAALWALLERGRALPAERWLDALGASIASASRADLRDALHVRGIAMLGDLAALERAGDDVLLRATTGLAPTEDGTSRARPRRVSGERIAALRDIARATVRHLDVEPSQATLATHVARLATLADILGWDAATAGHHELAEVVPEPERCGDRPLRGEDWTRLLRQELDSAGTDPLGGQGGGVQVLTVTEARSRSFTALRVIGLNRGVFPRRVGEDPLLPDDLRRPLLDVLPDLPIKGEGHAEERFLFAQLLASAPRVHLSCAQSDASGRPSPASPLFERAAGVREACARPPVRAAHEALLHTALEGKRLAFAAALPEALASGRAALGLLEQGCERRVLHARLAVLRELDPRDARRRAMGPYLGVVGSPRTAGDPRHTPPSVTLLEAAARCPWQAFLVRILRLAPPPDARGALPAASDARLVGNVVHTALQRLCDPAQASSGWPATAPSALLLDAARSEALKEGIGMPGYARALARRAQGFVEVARRLDLADPATLCSVEAEHEVEVRDLSGAPRPLRFRVDRIDSAGGETRFSDWKTGRLVAKQSRAENRSEEHRKHLARGALLQAHAYTLTGSRGRYVYLDPDLDDAQRVLEAEPTGPQREAFDASVATLLAALDHGAFPPRLRAPGRDEEPRACRGCEVKAACLRGDSGARGRLGAWAAADAAASDLERAALAVWRLAGADS